MKSEREKESKREKACGREREKNEMRTDSKKGRRDREITRKTPRGEKK